MGCALKMGEGPARQAGQAAPGSRKGKETDPSRELPGETGPPTTLTWAL